MVQLNIRGVPIEFPYEPYEIQKDYMEKVIECLQNECNGVLESPTGTGKTASLLCASLGWLQIKKAQIQSQRQLAGNEPDSDFLANLKSKLEGGPGGKAMSGRAFIGLPTIIYSSRTHSQLSQAMQELKRTAYNYMKAVVLGSREQMCIHPELATENNSIKTLLCGVKVKTRSCQFYNRVSKCKMDHNISEMNVIDIEDIVKMGQQSKFCPYYMSRELKQHADILFMPYQYLLDPRIRTLLGVELSNNVVIFDEAHNVEKICEDSASLQIKSSDITLCIEDVTAVMERMAQPVTFSESEDEAAKDFTAEELMVLKQICLDLEKAVDEIDLKSDDTAVLEGTYMFTLLEKCGISGSNCAGVISLMEKIIQFLAVSSEGPFQRKGTGLKIFQDLLQIVFAGCSDEFKKEIHKSYKVHVELEPLKDKKKTSNNWFSKGTTKSKGKLLSYWCFNPGFGMNMLTSLGLRCMILTSGTLAPLRPLISELNLKAQVCIENPHIVKGDQICVKILERGPDGELLNCSFQNRDNMKYISSLGRSLVNLIRLIPNGVLVFFPSYPIMQKYVNIWQEMGIWENMCKIKAVYVEPKQKEVFNSTMTEYYAKVNDPILKGAVFMGVCRGKVSEGLDFADMNGRAVIVIGLPFPPLKDPRVILKKKYLDLCNAQNKEYPRGDEWYTLEATKAVNQAVGRVIRHRYDYGAILLLDSRFNSPRIKSQLSLWLRDHIQAVSNFGEIVRYLSNFFRNAATQFPVENRHSAVPDEATVSVPAEFEIPKMYKQGNFDFTDTSFDSQSTSSSDCEVVINKRPLPSTSSSSYVAKKRKITLIPNKVTIDPEKSLELSSKEYIVMVQNSLGNECFKEFLESLTCYKNDQNIAELIKKLDAIFGPRHQFRYLIEGLNSYIKNEDRTKFKIFCDMITLT